MRINCRNSVINVFIVEDNEDILMLYKNFFKYLGFNILDIANNGLEAIKKYIQLEVKPDVILMDNRMPIMNGIEASKIILQINPNVKIIFVSGDSKIKDYVLEIGAINFVEKPFTINELQQKIIEIL
jgi:CheY-like chemotaxis protein